MDSLAELFFRKQAAEGSALLRRSLEKLLCGFGSAESTVLCESVSAMFVVTQVLLQHEKIRECAVVGKPDETWGEKAKPRMQMGGMSQENDRKSLPVAEQGPHKP